MLAMKTFVATRQVNKYPKAEVEDPEATSTKLLILNTPFPPQILGVLQNH